MTGIQHIISTSGFSRILVIKGWKNVGFIVPYTERKSMPAGSIIIHDIVSSMKKRGFLSIKVIDTAELCSRLRLFPGKPIDLSGIPSEGSLIIAAFPYHRPDEIDDLSTPGDPHALIAPFARRHYYREAVMRMKAIFPEARLFSNSRLPEKAMAAAVGLGFYGKNGLIITEESGSRIVIAGMFIPVTGHSSGSPPVIPPGERCGSCSLCLDACPVGALDGSGGLDRSRCLQSLASEHTVLPENAMLLWGKRLYGCDICQQVCPYNASPVQDLPPICGELGASVSIKMILDMGIRGEMKTWTKGTALGLSWINPLTLIRNAIIASTGETSLKPFILACLDHQDRVVRDTAERIYYGF